MRKNGFTLVEMLLTVVIGGLVAITAAATIHSVGHSRNTIDNYTTLHGELRYARQLIEQDLNNLYRDKQRDNWKLVGEYEMTESGLKQRLVFYTVSRTKMRIEQPESDVYEVEYYLQQSEGRSVLMRRMWPCPDPDADAAGVLYPVAEHIVGFSARFYDGAQWMDEWPMLREQIPDLVEITLRAGNEEMEGGVETRFVTNIARWPSSEQSGGDNSHQGVQP